MPSRTFVLNDWLLHNLAGESGSDAQIEAVRLLQRLRESEDRITYLEGSSWARKTYSLMQFTDPLRRSISKFFRLSILLDPAQCHIVQPNEVKDLPLEIARLVHPDDHYLMHCYYAAPADWLVTTDQKLYESLHDVDFPVQLRDNFVKEYLAEN